MNFSINSQLFNHIQKSPIRYKINNIEFVVSDCKNCCLAFIIPKSMGPAHQRNKFKRRCKYSYEILKNIKRPVGFIIRPKSLNIPHKDIFASFNKIMSEF